MYTSYLVAAMALVGAAAVQGAGIFWTEPAQGAALKSGVPVNLVWLYDPNGQTFAAKGSDNVELQLSDLRNGPNTGSLIPGVLATVPLEAGKATVTLPNVAPGNAYVIRAAAGNPQTFAYSYTFTIGEGGAASGTAPAPGATTAPAPATPGAPVPATPGSPTAPSTGVNPATATPQTTGAAGTGKSSAQSVGASILLGSALSLGAMMVAA
ncbi:hypothetical protein DFS34DRAFT_686852 [Phlyctochytrium arcticum]|nr:hypothetical protein DFS34DRAFT_686852 [Phlyctochytrium arcticum]